MSPVREAKGRQLSREYMADRVWMTENSPAEREWYMLTALYADDSGYLPWDLQDNAANLYRYDTPRRREARVAGHVAHFTATGRFLDLTCGHAYMPGVAKHPRGKAREHHVMTEHSGCTTSALPVHPPSLPFLSLPNRASPRADDGSKEPTKNDPRETRRTNGPDTEPTSLRAILDPATAARLGIAPEETNP